MHFLEKETMKIIASTKTRHDALHEMQAGYIGYINSMVMNHDCFPNYQHELELTVNAYEVSKKMIENAYKQGLLSL